MEPNKQYGLIKMNTKTTKDSKVVKKPLGKASALFDDSDSDDAAGDADLIMPSKPAIKRKDQIQISQAIEEDSSVYQYDEVYDEIKGNDKKDEEKKPAQNKARYINNMLKTAERRNKEKELISERKIQRERENEKDLFKDKETFVTSAYRAKLEEIKKAQAESERQERIESMLDVTKQSGMDGFYRNLYKHNMAHVRDDEKPEETLENETSETETISFNKKSKQSQKRRIRDPTSEDDNLADEEEESVVIKRSRDIEPAIEHSDSETPAENSIQAENSDNTPANNDDTKDPPKDQKDDSKKEETEIQVQPEIKKKKPDRMTVIKELFKKRTVGIVFEEAQKRYFERKALRCS